MFEKLNDREKQIVEFWTAKGFEIRYRKSPTDFGVAVEVYNQNERRWFHLFWMESK